MAISMHIKTLFSLLTGLVVSSCSAADCGNKFGYSFVITNWKYRKPDSVFVYKYMANGFSTLVAEKLIPFNSELQLLEGAGAVGLVISPEDSSIESLDSRFNYRIVLDGREYYVSDIVSSDQPTLGCSIQSAKVNGCSVRAGKVVVFDAECR